MLGNCLENVKKSTPLVHNITNYVTVNDVANVLLACGGMARHHEDLEKTFTEEQKEIFEKFHVAKSKTIEYRFGRVKPPKARSWQSRASAGDRQRLCILLLIIKKYIMIFEICNAFVTL